MSTITAILEVNEDGTLHLPIPPGMGTGKIAVTATLTPAERAADSPMATQPVVTQRLAALRSLREHGGLRAIIPDPLAWQREQRYGANPAFTSRRAPFGDP